MSFAKFEIASNMNMCSFCFFLNVEVLGIFNCETSEFRNCVCGRIQKSGTLQFYNFDSLEIETLELLLIHNTYNI